MLATALLAGSAGGVVGAQLDSDGATPATSPGVPDGTPLSRPSSTVGGPGLDLSSILAKVEPAVVAIRTSTGEGTGVVISSNGEVLTNAHVVAGSTTVRVTVGDEVTARTADVVGSDAARDLAVLKIRDATGLPTAELDQSAGLQVGDDVVAIGNALGLQGTPTVTRGIVSALDRTLDDLTGLIQTDAAINPGNSGGPLVNAQGEVVGINTAIATGRNGVAQNIGFAISVERAAATIERLRSGGSAGPGALLGVSTTDPTDGSRGAAVARVEAGGPAAVAGLRAGDLIVSVDGQPVDGSGSLTGRIRDLKPGATVEIRYVRDGRTATTTATLGTRGSS